MKTRRTSPPRTTTFTSLDSGPCSSPNTNCRLNLDTIHNLHVSPRGQTGGCRDPTKRLCCSVARCAASIACPSSASSGCKKRSSHKSATTVHTQHVDGHNQKDPLAEQITKHGPRFIHRSSPTTLVRPANLEHDAVADKMHPRQAESILTPPDCRLHDGARGGLMNPLDRQTQGGR